MRPTHPRELTDRLARQVLEGVVAGEGTPAQVVESRGLKVVSDDTALIAAIDEALAAQPDVLEKIRDGKVQAAGVVMKAMKGAADTARVWELVLERARGLRTALVILELAAADLDRAFLHLVCSRR